MTASIQATFKSKANDDNDNNAQIISKRKSLRAGDRCIHAPICQGHLAMVYGELNCYVCGKSQYPRIIVPGGSKLFKF